MTSTETEATSSLHQNGRLAVRLSPAVHRPSRSPTRSPGPDQNYPDGTARKRPKKPAIPRHPIPTMQEAFAESLAEITSGTLLMKPKLRVDTPQIRRDRLLDQERSEGPPEALWRLRPGQNCHELRKLLAQIAFGVYLLLKGMANSDAQVVAILQGHIDEVDDFLKTAMEDLKLATQDLNTRLDYLKLPLGNLPAFEEMLEDREFRLRIVEGNVRIEHILSRTEKALLQTIQDVSEGQRSTREFTAYLTDEEHGSWRFERPPEVADIFEAMRGNAEGWLNAFADLEEKTNTLDLLISKLTDMVTEMDRCAGEVSRRTRFSVKPYTVPELANRVSHDSQVSSFLASYEATPPVSPGINIPPVPPRISLRFSSLGDILVPNFLDMGPGSNDLASDSSILPTFQYTPPAEVAGGPHGSLKTEPPNPFDNPTMAAEYRNVSDEHFLPNFENLEEDAVTIKSNTTAIRDADAVVDVVLDDRLTPNYTAEDELREVDAGASYEAAHITQLSPIQDAQDEDMEEAKEAKEDNEPLYILQPKTYTPQTSPLPSPCVSNERQTSATFQVPASPPRSRGEPPTPRLYIPPVEARTSYPSPPSPVSGEPQPGNSAVSRMSSSIISPADSEASMLLNDADDTSGMPKKKSSIRERVSLRTTPPDAIHVPPPDVPLLQRPVFASPRTYQNYRTFTGPDSAYSSEADRATNISFHDGPRTNASPRGQEFSPPVFPNLVPSPHSDQQYFRPVLASPHSPLQQRPHTAGQVPSRPYHLRNAPSTMGMSMLSSVTTMTQDSKGKTVLKKKRSAFGWLKKAFTLDEDEKMTFDQRRQAQERNLYYDGRSPKFLDGKRIK